MGKIYDTPKIANIKYVAVLPAVNLFITLTDFLLLSIVFGHYKWFQYNNSIHELGNQILQAGIFLNFHSVSFLYALCYMWQNEKKRPTKLAKVVGQVVISTNS